MDISDTALQEYTLQDEELKSNKSPGFDIISSSIVTFGITGMFHLLKHISNFSLQTEFFPNRLRTARFHQFFKKDEKFLFTYYRTILVIPCFSKLLERLMYNKYTTTLQVFFTKLFSL